MSQLDILLSIIENPTRRRILQELVREPHYPLQLSKELGVSQQAVIKHLKILEENDLVSCYMEESDLGGPQRKRYVPTMKFTLIVDVGPAYFNAELLDVDLSKGDDGNETMDEHQLEDIGLGVSRLRDLISQIDDELGKLQIRRGELVELKERVLSDARRLVEENLDDYQLRRILYEYIHRPSLDLIKIARELALRDEVVRESIKRILGEEEI
ncbi:MAG: helix-turn-helix domain-containing protein [Methanomassiliicoccales archaeon]|nr:helix-turn-helix domain-containing protein [Methanomassiliicoccales archaeon]NYT15175.1 helix-turn-helix domain-containing protein [Methanomassiliicoccales archaeon]